MENVPNIMPSSLEERFNRITRIAKKLFGVEISAILMTDNDQLVFKSQIGIGETHTGRENSFFDHVIDGAGIFVVPDAREDVRFQNNSRVVGSPYIRFYAGYPLETHGGDRLGVIFIGDTSPKVLTKEEEDLFRDLSLWAQREITSDRELDQAALVQVSLQPKLHLNLPNYDVAGASVNARTISGDFYDWYSVDEGEAFTLADVMGKGIAAAIIAASVRAVLRAESRSDDISQTVENTCVALSSDLNSAGTFVTLFHSRLNTSTGVLRYVDAGHGLSLIVRENGSSERLFSDNPPLGVQAMSPWEEKVLVLNPSDTLISVSDGVLDLFGGTLAGFENLTQIVHACATAQEVVDKVVALAGGYSPDDITVLVIRRAI